MRESLKQSQRHRSMIQKMRLSGWS